MTSILADTMIVSIIVGIIMAVMAIIWQIKYAHNKYSMSRSQDN